MYGVLWASPNTVSAVHRAERMGLRVKKEQEYVFLTLCELLSALCLWPFDSVV